MWALIASLFDRLLDRVRIGHEANAKLCTDEHLLVSWADQPRRRGPLHVDVRLTLWSEGQHRTTVRDVAARAAGQHLHPVAFRQATLGDGEKPTQRSLELHPPEGGALAAREGDPVTVKLLLTRGRARNLRLRIGPE